MQPCPRAPGATVDGGLPNHRRHTRPRVPGAIPPLRPRAAARRPPPRRVYSGPTAMTPQPEDVARVLDTRGDEPLGATYVAVVVVEALVLAALWLFSRHFSG